MQGDLGDPLMGLQPVSSYKEESLLILQKGKLGLARPGFVLKCIELVIEKPKGARGSLPPKKT